MKLRNKKTGEIVEATDFNIISDYNSLAELNEEWEDYKEPKKHYFTIDGDGVLVCRTAGDFLNEGLCKQIGNYFETKEEAEKAVEELKAWKRLKDYHIKFKLDFVRNTISFTYRLDGTLYSAVNEERIIFEDMKTIFGGEE